MAAPVQADLREKIVVVTGASSGIGEVAARELAKMGAHIVMVVRNPAKGDAAASRIREAGGTSTELVIADLSSIAETRRAAAEIRERHPTIDVLLNNAGAMNGTFQKSPDGFELTFATNHLSYFVMTLDLLPALRAAPKARIVSVASEASRWAGIDFDNLNAEKEYTEMGAYSQSKCANIMFTFELARRLAGSTITANALHPGGVNTNFLMDTGRPLSKLGWKLISPFLRTPEQGADDSIYLCASPEVEGLSGGYYHNRKIIKAVRPARDEAGQQRLWQLSEQMTGVRWA